MSDKQDDQPAADGDENEIVSAARASRQSKAAADASVAEEEQRAAKTGFGWKKAAGIGIGSAAVLAALIFANRDKR